MHLIAVQAFGAYEQGARISDAAEIESILGSESAAFVVKVSDSGDPDPAAEAKPE